MAWAFARLNQGEATELFQADLGKIISSTRLKSALNGRGYIRWFLGGYIRYIYNIYVFDYTVYIYMYIYIYHMIMVDDGR